MPGFTGKSGFYLLWTARTRWGHRREGALNPIIGPSFCGTQRGPTSSRRTAVWRAHRPVLHFSNTGLAYQPKGQRQLFADMTGNLRDLFLPRLRVGNGESVLQFWIRAHLNQNLPESRVKSLLLLPLRMALDLNHESCSARFRRHEVSSTEVTVGTDRDSGSLEPALSTSCAFLLIGGLPTVPI